MAIESSIVPLPAELILIPAAWKAAGGELNVAGVWLSGTLGAVLGALANYALALTLGRLLIYRFAGSRAGRMCGFNRRKVASAEACFRKYGNVSTLVGRLMPGVRSLISLPAGLVRMPMRPFLVYTFAGAGLWNLLLVGIGYTLHGQLELIESYYAELSFLFLAGGLLFFTGMLVWKRRRKKSLKSLSEHDTTSSL